MGITSTTLDPGLDTVSYDEVVNDMDVPRTGDADPVMINRNRSILRTILFSSMIRAVSIYQPQGRKLMMVWNQTVLSSGGRSRQRGLQSKTRKRRKK